MALSHQFFNAAALFDIAGIEAMIPHRPPFLLIDRILRIDKKCAIAIGQKNSTINEPYFQGHFPKAPIMPGVLIVEALAQTGGVLIHQMGFCDKIPVISHLKEARFRKGVLPGDVLLTHCEGIHLSARGGRICTHALVGNRIVAEVEIGYVLVDPITLV